MAACRAWTPRKRSRSREIQESVASKSLTSPSLGSSPSFPLIRAILWGRLLHLHTTNEAASRWVEVTKTSRVEARLAVLTLLLFVL
jgi:hypothetical protein